jgi:hypothetical protein
MAETPDKGVGETVKRLKEIVAQEVDEHKAEDVDLEDASGGSAAAWTISYTTDPPPTL